MVCLDTLTIWYNWWSWTYETPIQNPPCTSTTVREVLSQTTLSLDNCYSTSRSWDPLDLDWTWFNEVWFEPNPTIYKISCPEPVKPLYSHGHIDTLHMRHIQETIKDYSAMRGPCPEGFHIPLSSEWKTTHGILVWLWISLRLHWPQLSYLKIPDTWSYQYWGSLARRNTVWQARCCDTYNGNWRSIYWFRDDDWSNNSKSNVMIIRPRKDVPVVPDNTWTTIFDWSSVASWAWIFWKEDQQIISLSSDGTNWITISDRNVWATKAWTEKNSACVWKVFQRWNNYWFTYNWDSSAPTFPNRTSTKIDVSWYWPSEYSSSTYYDWWSNQDWASVANNDLRWWVTWPQTKTIDRREPVYYGPQPTLLSYEEIIAMAGNDKVGDIVAILNEHPEEYYNKLSSEWHMELDSYHTGGADDWYVILDVYNYVMYFWKVSSPWDHTDWMGNCNDTHIWYIPSTWLWDYFCDNDPT